MSTKKRGPEKSPNFLGCKKLRFFLDQLSSLLHSSLATDCACFKMHGTKNSGDVRMSRRAAYVLQRAQRTCLCRQGGPWIVRFLGEREQGAHCIEHDLISGVDIDFIKSSTPYVQRHVRCARCSTYAEQRLIRTSPEFWVPCILKQAQSVASEYYSIFMMICQNFTINNSLLS